MAQLFSFIVYDSKTGGYVAHGMCGQSAIYEQAGPGLSTVMVDAIPTPAGYFDIDLTRIGDFHKVYAFADVTRPRTPTENEAGLPDIVAAQAWSAIVNAERDRRIRIGTTVEGVRVTGSADDARNLTNLALGAQLRLAGGVGELTTFRDGDNTDHELTPEQVLMLWQQSAAYVSALYAASWAIKAATPVPTDVADDALWPAAG